HFRIKNDPNQIEVHIRYSNGNKTAFYANLIQKKVMPMSSFQLAVAAIRRPFDIAGTMPRILYQAAILHFYKKIPAARRPIPIHPNTLRHRPPTWIETVWMRLVLGVFSKFKVGLLIVTLPDGSERRFGGSDAIIADMHIQDYSVFKSLAIRGEIGLGEGYSDGRWTTNDLTQLLGFFIRNRNAMNRRIRGNFFHKWIARFGHFLKRNTIGNSKTNIEAHYDLSNALYELFLDREMNYSSAYFPNRETDLESAQVHKLDRLISALRVRPNHHVLEIGSGWGAAAIRLAKTTGCKVTTLTLSRKQYDVVQSKIKKEGLEGQITVLLEDYRNHVGQYDRILSIEMIEAVGHDYLPDYFRTIDRLLSPNGIVAIQAITIPDQRYADYCRRVDWIQKYIFPGGHLPSVEAIQTILSAHTGFVIE
ncbi:DUF1365 family protein, partial [bacterium]|nr:DUF1365 family protein [bacterium]